MESSFDLPPLVTWVVLEVYVTSVYLRNLETKGDPPHLPIPFSAQVNFVYKLNLCSQIGVLMPDYFQGLMSEIISIWKMQYFLQTFMFFYQGMRVLPCGIMCHCTFRSRVTFAFFNISKRLVWKHQAFSWDLKYFCNVIINSFNIGCKRNFKCSFIVVLLCSLNQGKKMLA